MSNADHEQFYDDLHRLGFQSLAEYIASDCWKKTKAWMKQLGIPRHCLACDAAADDLHHVAYDNIGEEQYEDLMPLCRKCHGYVHQYLKLAPDLGVEDTFLIFQKIYRFSDEETFRRFADFIPGDWVPENQRPKVDIDYLNLFG